MKTEQILRNIFSSNLGLESDDIKLSSTQNEMGIDSVSKLCIIVDIENAFGISISNEQFDALREFEDYINIVKHKTNEE